MYNDTNFLTVLSETINLMTSDDYKDRFRAEYYQTKIRRDKLLNMLENWNKGNLNFQPVCKRSIYEKQIKYMNQYLAILIQRAQTENISIII